MIRKWIELLKDLFHKIRFRNELRRMDTLWWLMGGNCFGIFPPSFYYTHTEEEIKQAKEEILVMYQEFLDKYGLSDPAD